MMHNTQLPHLPSTCLYISTRDGNAVLTCQSTSRLLSRPGYIPHNQERGCQWMSPIFRASLNGDFKSPPPSLLTLCYSSSTCSLSILSIMRGCKDAGLAGNYGNKVLNGILARVCFYFYETLINQRSAGSRRMTVIAFST